MRLARVPVSIRRCWLFVPKGFGAWVPVRRTIIFRTGEPITERGLAHELCHVLQAEDRPWPIAYVLQWVQYGFKHRNMPFEIAAHKAEVDPWFRAWARDLLKGLWAEGNLD
jgi:hypothetical protein